MHHITGHMEASVLRSLYQAVGTLIAVQGVRSAWNNCAPVMVAASRHQSGLDKQAAAQLFCVS